MKNIFLGLLILFSLNTFAQFSGGGGTAAPSTLLTYGRVNALNDLPNVTYTNANNGVKIPFSNTIYSNGVSFSGTDVMIPSVTGRYRLSWLMQASSNEFAGNGYFVVMQNNVFVGRVLYDMMEAAGVNQCSGFIDADLTAGLGVELRYQSAATSDQVIWQVGSYFQLTQLTGLLPVTGQSVDYLKVSRITSSQPLAINTDILFNSTPTGNISYNAGTGLATLIAGKSYSIKSRLVGRNDGTGTTGRFITYGIKTSANVDLPTTTNATQGTQFLASSVNNEGGGSEATAIFTPTVNTDIKIRITGIDGNNWTLDNERSYLEITQLGTSAVSNFIGATASTAGTTGFIAAPLAGDQLKVFKADGTYGRGKLVLVSTINTSGTLGGVTFSITTADPWTLSTSVAATGTTTANVYQFSAGQTWDYWTSATPGVTSILNRGKSWAGTTSGGIGLIGTSYISACTGVLIANGNTYQIQANSYNTGGVCIIEQLN